MISEEQYKAIKSLKRAIAKCEQAHIGIIAEDDSLTACNKYDFEDFDNTPWHFMREKQYEEGMLEQIKSGGCFLGSGGA